MTRPYEVVRAYIDAGWDAPFPLPAGKKFPPPEGFTGAGGRYPTNEDFDRWIEQDRYGNYGVRAPLGVIGIDWDFYKGHQLYDWVMPYICRAPRSTSKGGDDESAIYWVRVPVHLVEQLRDRHFAEAGTEVIRAQHRYAVVWPSVHPDTGQTYRWYAAGSETPLDGPPELDDLPAVTQEVLTKVIAQYGGGRRTGKSSGVSRRGAGELAPAVELSELGSLKALVRGYHPYEVEVSPELKHRRHSFEMQRIDEITDALDELVTGADAWESSVGTLTFKLISLALAPWSQIELGDVPEFIEQYGPTCEKAVAAGVHDHRGTCWTAADNRVRAERSIEQHDGGWTQLPAELRRDVREAADDSTPAPADVSSQASPAPAAPAFDDEDDDFFDEPVRRDPAAMFLRLDRSLTRQARPRPIAGGLLYENVFNIVSGRGGLGKSTAVQAICAKHGPTLWLSTEESWGAVHDRALVLGYDDFYAPNEPLTVMDSPVIFQWLATMPDVRTVVIDNLQAFFKLGADSTPSWSSTARPRRCA
jgi:hypothetical protein